jgi:tight adherence protein C
VIFILFSVLVNALLFAAFKKNLFLGKLNEKKVRPTPKKRMPLFRKKQKPRHPPESIQALYDLAELIDFLVLCLDAGYTVPLAYAEATRNLHQCAVKEAALKVCTHYFLGCSFNQALQRSSTDGRLSSFDQFLESLQMAMRMGSNLVAPLEAMTDNIRNKANSTIEELAGKAPVKMLFPLVFFIFPVIFVLLGSSVVLDLISVLG